MQPKGAFNMYKLLKPLHALEIFKLRLQVAYLSLK